MTNDEFKKLIAEATANATAKAIAEATAKTTAMMDRFIAENKERDRKIAEENRKYAEEKKERDRKIAEENKERDRKYAEEKKERDRKMDEEFRKLKESQDRTDKQIGYLGRSLGDVVELVLVPGICEKMNKLGHNFTRLGPNKVLNRENKKTLVEIDLWLENGNEAMAVEIKTNLSVKWVNKHLERLNLLRKHENITGAKGKILYAAVAGIVIDEDARDLATEKGMYIIDLIEDEDRLEVTAPKKGNIGRW